MKLEWKADASLGDHLTLVTDDCARPLAEVLCSGAGSWLAAEHCDFARTVCRTRGEACALVEDHFATNQLGARDAIEAARAERLRHGWN